MRTATEADREYVARRREAARWYAWGRQDGGQQLIGDAEDFAHLHAEQARRYRAEETGSLVSVRTAFEDWQGAAADRAALAAP